MRPRLDSLPLLLTLTLLAACVDSGPAAPAEDGAGQLEQAIRNGTRQPTVVPMTDGQMLAIGWLHQPGFPETNFCTGTLITSRVVITASHCTEGAPPDQFAFGVGLTPSTAVASFEVVEVHEHPQVDAAMLVLAEDATVQVPSLTPVPYNTAPLSTSLEGSTVEASGYGETFDPNRDGRWFAALELDTVGQRYLVVDGNGERGICFGDSGGPLLSTDASDAPVVLAVESNGEESCLGRDNMTRLDVLANWIDPVVGDPSAPNPGDERCEALDYKGRCNGVQAEWCENGVFKSRDCGTEGLGCGFIDEEVGFYCVDPSADPDPTDDPDPDPSDSCTPADTFCDGDLRVRCDNGRVVHDDCALIADTCDFNDQGVPVCVQLDGDTGFVDGDPSNNDDAGVLDDTDPTDDGADPDGPQWTDSAQADAGPITSKCQVAPTRTNGTVGLLLVFGLGLVLVRRGPRRA